ncbi:MAG: arginase family protein, partial [Acidimicrobiales bacterium]
MIGSRYQPFFQGIPTFFRAPLSGPTALTAEDVAVIGVPFDAGITLGRQGAKHGPRSIREASCYYASLYDCTPGKAQYHVDSGLVQTVTSEQRFKDLGDVDVFPLDVAATTDAIVEGVASAARGAGFTLVLGGDHYVAYPSFKGFVKGIRSRQPDASFGYVHIDSHTDFWDEYGFGGRYNHATAVRRITEEGLVDRDHVVWLGLNGMMPLEHHRLMVKHHMTALTASQLTEASWKQRLDDAIQLFR